MHQCERGDHLRVEQVWIIFADLISQQHAFVNQSARRQRRNIERFGTRQIQRTHRVFGALAQHKQLAFESVNVSTISAALDDGLPDDRLHRFNALAQARVVGGHITPAKQCLSFSGDALSQLAFTCGADGFVLRQEKHADAVVARSGQGNFLFGKFTTQEGVRCLNQNSGAITCEWICTGCATVTEIGQDL